MLKDAKWLAEKLGLAESTVKSKKWRDRVNIPHTKIGGVVRFDEYLIDLWIQSPGSFIIGGDAPAEASDDDR